MKLTLNNKQQQPNQPFMKSNKMSYLKGDKDPRNKQSKKQIQAEKMERELYACQERFLKLNMRTLKRNEMQVLQNFISANHKMGSKAYQTLPDKIKLLINKMSYESSLIYLKYTKNIFRRIQIHIGLWGMKKMIKPVQSKKKKKA